MRTKTLKSAPHHPRPALSVLVGMLAVCILSLMTAGRAYAYSASIDTTDDAYVSEAGSGNWTTEHDAVYQTYVGDTLDLCSHMSLDPVLAQMNSFEGMFPGLDTSQISLIGTNGDLVVTIDVPEGTEFDVGSVYMVDNGLYEITSTSTSSTVTGPGSFQIYMSLKQSFTKYDDLKAAISGLPSCNMGGNVPPDGFGREIRVMFPNVKINNDMLNKNVTTGMGTMEGGFSATASMYGGLIKHDFALDLTSHQYAGGVDAILPAGSTTTSVTVMVNPTTSVAVTKTWDHGTQAKADWPTSATIHLLAGGTEVDKATLSSDGSWTYRFEGLDPTKTYTVTEDAVENYSSTVGNVTGSASSGYAVNVANTYSGTAVTTSAKATKVWKDSNNLARKRPTSVTLQLQKTVAGTTSDVAGKTVTLDEDNGWSTTLTDLPANKNGEKVTYSYTEPTVPDGYTASYSADGLTVTNTRASAIGSTSSKIGSASSKSTSPGTGDATSTTLAFLLGAAGLAMIAAGLIRKRKTLRG